MVEEELRVRIFRYNPKTDSEPRYDAFMVPKGEKQRLIDILNYIRENLDITLCYDYSCDFRFCGRCGVRLNGKSTLACWTLVDEAWDEITIEPLRGFPVIKDLMVDRGKVERHMERLRPFLERFELPREEPERIPPELFDFQPLHCMECMQCQSVCPIILDSPTDLMHRFSGPLPLTWLSKYALDPRDEGDRLNLACHEGLFKCTLCKSCVEVCPKEIGIADLVVRMRAMAAFEGINPVPVHVKAAHYALETGRILETDMTPLHQALPEVVKAGSLGRMDRVALFLGCMIDYHPRLQGWGRAAIEILKRLGVTILIPKDQVCCGMPMIYSGQLGAVRGLKDRLIQNNIQVFEALGVERVIVLCPACSDALKNHYPSLGKELVGRKPLFKALEFTEYLTQNFDVEDILKAPIEMRVTYHDPCHLRRVQGIYREPRDILEKIPGLDLEEMEEPDLCCGAGGGVKEAYPELASKVVWRKVEMIRDIGAEKVVTECPSCYLQLVRGLSAGKLRRVKVETIPEIMLRAAR